MLHMLAPASDDLLNKLGGIMYVVATNYVTPKEPLRYDKHTAEGHIQGSKKIIESLKVSGLDPQVISVGFPFSPGKVTQSVGRNLHVVYDQFKYSSHFNTFGIDPLYWKMYNLLNASFVSSIIDKPNLVYLLNIPPKIYSLPIKLMQRLKQRRFVLACHIFHSVRLGAPVEHRYCDLILCSNLEAYKHYSRVADGRVFYIPCPIDTERFKPRDKTQARRQLGLPPDDKIIGYVGHATPERGVLDLLEAFSALSRDREDLSLVIVTPPHLPSDPEAPFIPAGIDPKKVKIINRIIPIEQFYNAVDLVALPYQRPHLATDPPISVAEAMASGVPLITSLVGSIRDIANEDRTFLLIPGDIEALCTKIELIIDDPVSASLKSGAAREYVEKNLSLKVVGRRLKVIFGEYRV